MALTDKDYEELADHYATHPIEPADGGEIEYGPAALKRGRPAKGAAGNGESKPMSVRFPDELRAELLAYADDNAIAVGEVVREAVREYLDRRAEREFPGVSWLVRNTRNEDIRLIGPDGEDVVAMSAGRYRLFHDFADQLTRVHGIAVRVADFDERIAKP